MASSNPNRKLLISVDVEALPARASTDHVTRLIWGAFESGRAGIAEICDSIERFGGVGLFFLEVAGSANDIAAYREVNAYLRRRGHLVEWHFHPEILGKKFWKGLGATGKTLRQDCFDTNDAKIILKWGIRQFVRITGRNPIAYRAGSFRWNGETVKFLAEQNVAFSFNACAETAIKDNYCTYPPVSPQPFEWSNGVIEVPCGEYNTEQEIIHFRFPRRFVGGLTPRGLATGISEQSYGPVQILLHSWSFLDRDDNGHFYFGGLDRKISFERVLSSLVDLFPLPTEPKEYLDVIADSTCRHETVALPGTVDEGPE